MQRRIAIPLVSLALLAPLATACGSDDSSSSGTEAAPAETYAIVGDAEVKAGLEKSKADMASLATQPKPADDAVNELFEDWEGYEGTVKKNDKDTYLALEDALGAFKKAAADGDADGMDKALADFTSAADAYVAAHPA